ncbi:MAG: histidine kinase, partial [Oscillatoriales cyanobacterium RU_3_3]|nr:histidine kinase [Oscillatoriales cyanobacterium RU_3_3]
GPIMLAGAEATAIATTLAGTALGATAGGLIGALVGLGIPEEEAKAYSDRVARGDYLVLLNGTESEIAEAERVLSRGGIQQWGVYDYPATRTVRTERALDDDAYSPNQGVTGRRF